jgi:hypothetical protein
MGVVSGGSVVASNPQPLSVCFCTFGESVASVAGAPEARCETIPHFRYDNFTGCCGIVTAGAMRLDMTTIQMHSRIFDQCFSQLGVAGLLFLKCRGFSIIHVLFALLSSLSQESESGVAVTCVQCEGNCTIGQCAFAGTKRMAGYALWAGGPPSFWIFGWCFSGKKDEEVKIPDPMPVVLGNESEMFAGSCDTFLAFVLARPIGYLVNEYATRPPWVDRVFNGMIVSLLLRSAKYMLPAGVVVGALLWWLLRKVPSVSQRKRPRRDRLAVL